MIPNSIRDHFLFLLCEKNHRTENIHKNVDFYSPFVYC